LTFKRIVFGIVRNCKEILSMSFFGLFPVVRKRVLFMSYYGKHTNCNPYAIYNELKKRSEAFEFVWVDQSGKIAEKSVKYRSVRFYYYLRTSQFLIFNARPNLDIKKRKGQRYVQTWHSSLGFKMIEKDAEATLDKKYVKKAKEDSRYIDLLISGCRFRTQCFERNFWYDGEIAEIGTPRNDVLFSVDKDEIAHRVKAELGIPEHTKIVLFAPTFRNGEDLSYVTSLNAISLKQELETHFSGTWQVVYRLHPNVRRCDILPEGVIDASDYKDMQKLLLATDVLLTDYSSVMFDYMLLGRPCFLFAPDYENYVANERNTYFRIDELPFTICQTNNALISAIRTYSYDVYEKDLLDFKNRIGSFENGTACTEIIEWIKANA